MLFCLSFSYRQLQRGRSFIIANYASALAIELRRGSLPDNRDFVRFKFKNGTSEGFRTLHAFAHGGDMPLTEFIYRIEVCVLSRCG